MGLVADLYIPMTENYPLLYVRVLYIRERPQGETRFISSAVTIQFPVGLAWPIGEKSFAYGAFYGKQSAHERSKRSTLDVINESTGGTTIAVAETVALKVTFTNTSVYNYEVNVGDTLTINMPLYFSDDDVANMSIDSTGWSCAPDSGKLVLTATSTHKWDSDSAMTFEITNVSSSKEPPTDQQSWTGNVSVSLQIEGNTLPIVASSEFDLVWSSSMATLTWSAKLDTQYFTFTDGAPTSGTCAATADPGDVVETLTTAQQVGTDDIWVLGYVYNYNTSLPNNPQPQVAAVWWKQDAVKTSNNYYDGDPVSPGDTDLTTSCYYGKSETSGCLISIDVAFDS
jgi:hypothetical protein